MEETQQVPSGGHLVQRECAATVGDRAAKDEALPVGGHQLHRGPVQGRAGEAVVDNAGDVGGDAARERRLRAGVRVARGEEHAGKQS